MAGNSAKEHKFDMAENAGRSFWFIFMAGVRLSHKEQTYENDQNHFSFGH